jgi:ribosomal protein L7Ae-like RNA K-turn-binding protein
VTVDDILTRLLEGARLDGGSAAVFRGCQRRTYDVVVLATDAAPDLIQSVSEVANRANIRVLTVDTRVRLARIAGQRRPTSAVGARLVGSDVLTCFPAETIGWRVDPLIWFHSSRFVHLEAGYKRATLREGLRRPFALELGVVDAGSGAVRGSAGIEEVAWLRWGEIIRRPEILACEYPNDPAQLTAEMLEIYPALESSTWMTYYRFTYETIAL